MMHQKAVLFKDEETAEKILAEKNPKKIKALGRKVRNFDDESWVATVKDVIYKGNLAKFTQNQHMKEELLSTGDRIIAEASPYDRRYGIGLGASDARAQNPTEWRGSNWLGEAIMKVRNTIQTENG